MNKSLMEVGEKTGEQIIFDYNVFSKVLKDYSKFVSDEEIILFLNKNVYRSENVIIFNTIDVKKFMNGVFGHIYEEIFSVGSSYPNSCGYYWEFKGIKFPCDLPDGHFGSHVNYPKKKGHDAVIIWSS